MSLLRHAILLLAVLSGTGVVATRDPVAQAVTLSFHGLVLSTLFFLHAAPDVALSQVVVGAVVLPLMFLLALAKVRRQRVTRPQGRR